MSNIIENPCIACSTNQHCCTRLTGLLLTRDEFIKHFKNHEEGLSVRWSGKVVVVSVKEDGACPHWGKDGCRIYAERPIDCRVFPYIMTHVIEKSKKIKIVFHTRTDCPQPNRLFSLISEADVRELVITFGKKLSAEGDGKRKIVTAHREGGILDQLRNRIEAAISRRIYRRNEFNRKQ